MPRDLGDRRLVSHLPTLALTANLCHIGDWAFGTDKKYHAYRAQQKQQKAALAAKKSS